MICEDLFSTIRAEFRLLVMPAVIGFLFSQHVTFPEFKCIK